MRRLGSQRGVIPTLALIQCSIEVAKVVVPQRPGAQIIIPLLLVTGVWRCSNGGICGAVDSVTVAAAALFVEALYATVWVVLPVPLSYVIVTLWPGVFGKAICREPSSETGVADPAE